jgi:uncharacterized membrane protein
LISLLLATMAFVGTHFALSHPLRTRIVGQLGEAGFLLLYSIIALGTLGWMILAYRDIHDSFPLWIGPDWWWPIASALSLVAVILLIGSFFGNPAFPRTGAPMKPPPAAKGVFAITRHPMNWAFALWALLHISLWATPELLVVAGGILILAIGGSIGQDRKKERTIGPLWLQWEARTSFVPFWALLTRKARWRDASPGWIPLVGGLVVWLAYITFHAPAVSPIVWFWMTYL